MGLPLAGTSTRQDAPLFTEILGEFVTSHW